MSFRENTIVDIQADMVARLNSDPYFADVTVVDERVKDIESDINKALGVLTKKGSKVGACVIVLSPEATDQYPDNHFQGPLNLEITFRVLEHPTINSGAVGTQKEALAICRRIIRIMKHFVAGGYCQPLLPGTPVIRPASDPAAPVAYDVVMMTQEAISQNEVKCQTPQITAAGALVTIACGTADASVYYTLDGSYPWPGNSQAVLYSAPFTIVGQVLVRAGGYREYFIPSNVSSLRFDAIGTEDGTDLLGTEGDGGVIGQ